MFIPLAVTSHLGVRCENRWSSQGYYYLDGLPFVGKTGVVDEHTYVVTAFRAWSLAGGTAGGDSPPDLTACKENEWV